MNPKNKQNRERGNRELNFFK